MMVGGPHPRCGGGEVCFGWSFAHGTISSGYLVVVWCFVVDSVAHESGVSGGACAVPVPYGFSFHGWALDEGALSLLGDLEVVPVPCHEDVGCGAVVEFLAAPPFVVLVVAPLVSVGV